VWDGGRSVIVSFEAPTVRIERECIFVGGDENYSHWLFRNLLKLVSLDRDGVLHVLPWLLNEDLKPYQLEYLDMLGVPPPQRILVRRGQVVKCDALRVPALLTHPATIRHGIDWIRDRLREHLTPPERANERLYFSRADAGSRHIVNEAALFAALERYGFRMITPGRMSVTEQIRAFSSASIVVGAHGAGMTNIVFAPPHAAIVELCSTALSSMDDFRRAARAAGQRMTTLTSDRFDPHGPQGIPANYFVDVDAVVTAVERLI
jgi:capsular polysaccharide biosynthesis protein